MFKHLIILLASISIQPIVAHRIVSVVPTFPAVEDVDNTLNSPQKDAEAPTSTTKYENDLGLTDDNDVVDSDAEQTQEKIMSLLMDSITEMPEAEIKTDAASGETGIGINDPNSYDGDQQDKDAEGQVADSPEGLDLTLLASTMYLLGELEDAKSQSQQSEVLSESYMKYLETQLSFNNQVVKSIMHIHCVLTRAFNIIVLSGATVFLLMCILVIQAYQLGSLKKRVRAMEQTASASSDEVSMDKEIIVKV